ncbi:MULTISPECIES: response regulator transcription factor [Caballeronia]|jgi:DNA-binding response OmpR family regulator|uniref:Response regulator transcription factor n=3 Tax=Caballeronia TaxID=1827195 RepID=A0ACB5QNU8_9BURK|nr:MULTISPECIES: response regulator transcription factor [Caballeronia]MBC8636291.1 response regulator transcription factor [Caballeronia sp. EK]GJH16865.1 response regulator transcription factor [Caballeronia novacaledonica]GJH24608.1 response regulator transcription factor [Caballeronia novacaledonica]
MTLQPQHSILVVDDDHSMRILLIEYLSGHGYKADGAASAQEAIGMYAAKRYDLVLLDLGLPDGDGTDLARRWREQMQTQGQVPIMYITGRKDEADLVMGLELGADDYIVKPFSLREVLARMRAVMRRAGATTAAPLTRGKLPNAYRFAGWTLNLNTRRLSASDQSTVPLTNSEFNLLVTFLNAPGRIITREKLLESTRAFDDIYDRAIDVQILRLRRKIETDPKKPALLRTERGAGYIFDTDIEHLWT